MNAPMISLNGQRPVDAQDTAAVEGPTSRPAMTAPPPISQASGGIPTPEQAIEVAPPRDQLPARGSTPLATAKAVATPRDAAPLLADPLLALAADVLDDLEHVRTANKSRLRQLTRDEEDSDGEERGFGLTLDHPDVKRLATLVDALGKAEHDAELNLKRQLRKHPLCPWVKQARGVGEKQVARLLAAIGDPYWNDLHDRPRTVSELWAYCGYHVLPAGHRLFDAQSASASGAQTGGNPDQAFHDAQHALVGVAATRTRGQRANWSADAKTRAYLVAESAMKQLVKPCQRADGDDYAVHVTECRCSRYRVLYDAARVKYADATHQAVCRPCGPKGAPALPGSPLSLKHKQARALRIVAKEVLKGLWREAKRLHEDVQDDGHGSYDSHPGIASS